MKPIIKATKIIISLITSILIIIGILFVVLFAVGIQPYVVESGSMEPEIHTGSVCFINKRAKYEDMKVGDIIAFKLGTTSSYATHRIYAITEEGFQTKGDANENIDGPITTRDTFIGKNVASIPKVGFAVKIIQTPRGRIIVGTIIVVLIVAGIMIGEPSEKKAKRYKDDKE